MIIDCVIKTSKYAQIDTFQYFMRNITFWLGLYSSFGVLLLFITYKWYDARKKGEQIDSAYAFVLLLICLFLTGQAVIHLGTTFNHSMVVTGRCNI